MKDECVGEEEESSLQEEVETDCGPVRSQGGEVEKVHEVKNSGSSVRSNREFGKEVEKRE